MKTLGRSALIVGFAVAVAACSSTQPLARRPSSTPTTVETASRPMTPREAAIALGRRMLAEAVLPAGAQVSTTPPPSVLRGPSSVPAMGNLEFAHRLWTVDQAPHTVWQWLQAHTPRGFVKGSTSSGTDRGVPSWGVEENLSVDPPNVSYAALELGVAAGASGRAVVRVDSVVGWTLPRPADEFVPTRDRVVTVSVLRAYGPVSPVIKRVVTADPKLVEPIVRAFNALRVSAPDSVHGCPPTGVRTVSYRVAFSSSRTATPDVVASVGNCGGVGVTVVGRPAPGLGEFSDAAFADAVAHVLGLSHPHFD